MGEYRTALQQECGMVAVAAKRIQGGIRCGASSSGSARARPDRHVIHAGVAHYALPDGFAQDLLRSEHALNDLTSTNPTGVNAERLQL